MHPSDNIYNQYETQLDEAEALDTYTPFDQMETTEDEAEDEPVYEQEFAEQSYYDGETEEEAETSDARDIYDRLSLRSKGLASDTFNIAMNGYEKLLRDGKLKNKNILTIVDFNMPGDMKRMFIIDLANNSLVLQCKVSHGKNSVKPGDHKKYGTQFSNRIGSNQSSLGFYVTLKTYQGKHGLSLALEGVEKEFNSNAARRRVVVHGADYVRENDSSAAGLSWGCPAIDMKLVNRVINTIKEGTCFFIFFKDQKYLSESEYVPQGIISKVKNIASGIFDTASDVISTITSRVPSGIPASQTPTISVPGVDSSTVKRIAQFASIIDTISRENNFNGNIVRGIIAAESGGNPRSGEGKTGYKGLMQAGRDSAQFNPSVSIRRGIEKFKEFQGYLRSGLSKLNIRIDFPQDESYYKLVLACYNAGHVTVIKAIQYAHQNGNWQNWLAGEHYQRALLFSGGYDFYTNCTKGTSTLDIARAKAQRLEYRFSKDRKWYVQKDPPVWNAIASTLSPILRCWIQTKWKNTPGYLGRFAAYFRHYNSSAAQKEMFENSEFYESSEMEDHENSFNAETDFESENLVQLYGPEYFDPSDNAETESEQFTDELETEAEDPGSFGFDPEQEAIEEKYFYDSEDVDNAALSAESYLTDEQPMHTTTVPSLIGEDLSVPGYTCYVRINIGKGNYVLDKTGIYVPAAFNPSQPVVVVLYLHGMTGLFPGAKAMIDEYWTLTKLPSYDLRIREEINNAGKNVILVAPSLGNSPNAYQNSLSGKTGGFDAYMTSVLAAINTYIIRKRFNSSPLNFDRIILAAHSAGGSQMRRIALLQNPVYGARIMECWGFDSLYGGVHAWLQWAKRNLNKKLFIYFKSSTSGNAHLLKQSAKRLSNVNVIPSNAKNHFWVVKHHLAERVAAL